MDRRVEILKRIDREMLGVEIGPWHSPLAPKADGWHCLSMDVFDTETLRARASSDPNISAEQARCIEDVDLVGPANHLRVLAQARGLAGMLDYVVSSHNIEHIPDPISFFQDCGSVLKPGGVVSMAIPDRRACFDFFRPFTPLSAWIEAHLERRTRPTEAQVFELACLGAEFERNGTRCAGFDFGTESPANLVPFNRMTAAYAEWLRRLQCGDQSYQDTHCWAFTPASFELLMRDCRHLGLVPLEVIEISAANGHEFYVHLRHTGDPTGPEAEDAAYLEARRLLMHRVVDECGSNSLATLALQGRMTMNDKPRPSHWKAPLHALRNLIR